MEGETETVCVRVREREGKRREREREPSTYPFIPKMPKTKQAARLEPD